VARLPLPERIDRPGLVLRRTTVEDASAIARAVGENVAHLSPYMPWANDEENATEAFQRARIEGILAAADPEHYGYLIEGPAGPMLGTIGIHTRQGPGVLEIGYWVHVDHTRRGVCTAAAGVLTDVALAVPGIERVEIHCDAANTASARVPEKLGYVLDRVVDRMPQAPAESGHWMVWVARQPVGDRG
jgi:RimJ/RimL family protein N-acetyltransferase